MRLVRVSTRTSLRAWALAGAVSLLACRERSTKAVNDSTQPTVLPGEAASPRPSNYTWDRSALGRFFVVPGAEPSTAFLIDPRFDADQSLDTLRVDAREWEGASVELFSGAEASGRARLILGSRDTTSGCISWPEVQLEGEGLPARWRVGFAAGTAFTLALDSLPVMAQRDSVRLTIAIARATSRLPGDTSTAFHGRPFVVRQAVRFALDSALFVVVAEVLRSVSQEANPLQEQTLVFLEAAGGDSLLRPVYFERRVGREEDLEGIDVVAALRLPRGAAILLRRETEAGIAFGLYERSSSGGWQLRWLSATASC